MECMCHLSSTTESPYYITFFLKQSKLQLREITLLKSGLYTTHMYVSSISLSMYVYVCVCMYLCNADFVFFGKSLRRVEST